MNTNQAASDLMDYALMRQRAESSESRATAKSELIDSILATWEPMTERLLDAESRAAQLETDNDEMQSYINEIRVALHTEKDELTIDAVRRVISERDELARKLESIRIDATMPDGTRLSDSIIEVMHERYELRAKIENMRHDLCMACNETDDDVTRLSWLQSLITSVMPFIDLISGGDINAGMICISEVQLLHDDLQKLLSEMTV